jgi:hypothetical protein
VPGQIGLIPFSFPFLSVSVLKAFGGFAKVTAFTERPEVLVLIGAAFGQRYLVVNVQPSALLLRCSAKLASKPISFHDVESP